MRREAGFFEPEWPDDQHEHNFVYEMGQPNQVIGGNLGWKVCTQCGGHLLIRAFLDEIGNQGSSHIRERQPDDLNMQTCTGYDPSRSLRSR